MVRALVFVQCGDGSHLIPLWKKIKETFTISDLENYARTMQGKYLFRDPHPKPKSKNTTVLMFPNRRAHQKKLFLKVNYWFSLQSWFNPSFYKYLLKIRHLFDTVHSVCRQCSILLGKCGESVKWTSLIWYTLSLKWPLHLWHHGSCSGYLKAPWKLFLYFGIWFSLSGVIFRKL